VESPEEGLKDPENLRLMEGLQAWLAQQEGVSQSLSVVDSVKEMNRVMTAGEQPGLYQLPDSQAAIAQLYVLLEAEEDFESEVQDNYSVARITTRVQMSKAHELASRLPHVDAMIAEKYSNDDLRIHATGFVKLMGDMENYLLDSQIRSLLVAFGVIVLMLGMLLRSVRLALFSMIPNLSPILIGMGFMAAVRIPLDPGTVMIGSIALGLVVDDTVHFLVRLRRRIKAGDDLEDAIEHTIRVAGRPIIVTSLVLAGGFLILLVASFTPNLHFGAVTALVIMLALAADLLVLPASLLLIRPRL